MRVLPLIALVPLASAACGARSSGETLQLTGVAEHRLEIGDRLELDATNLPAPGDVRRIAVTLRGTMVHPGAAPCSAPVEYTLIDPPSDEGTRDPVTGDLRAGSYAARIGRTIRLEGAERLSFVVTGEMFAALSRCADDGFDTPRPGHVTLALGTAGDPHASALGLRVQIDGLAGVHAVSGTLRGVTLDLSALPSTRIAMEPALRRRAERTLAFLGVTLAPPHLSADGLLVAAVAGNSLAERAGLAPGDVLETMDGLTLLAASDVVPGPAARSVTLGLRRGEVRESRTVPLAGLSADGPGSPTDALVLAFLAWSTWRARSVRTPRLLARVSRLARARRRPSGVGARRFVRWFAATLAGRRSRRPSDPPPWVVRTVLATPWLATAALAPFAPALVTLDPDLSVVYAALAAVRLARTLLLHAHDPSPVTVAGTVRAIVHYVPCGATALAAVAGIVLTDGTLHARGLVAAQGASPWQWHLFHTPMGLAFGALFALGMLASGGTHPLSASPSDEPATRRVVHVAALLEWSSALGMAALASVLFLGGWQLPGISLATQESSALLQMLGVACCALKTLAVVLGLVAFRWAFPSLRVDRAVTVAWRAVAFATLGPLVTLGLWLAVSSEIPMAAHVALAHATFGGAMIATALAVTRRWRVRRAASAGTLAVAG